jgi:hypothetical protein
MDPQSSEDTNMDRAEAAAIARALRQASEDREDEFYTKFYALLEKRGALKEFEALMKEYHAEPSFILP